MGQQTCIGSAAPAACSLLPIWLTPCKVRNASLFFVQQNGLLTFEGQKPMSIGGMLSSAQAMWGSVGKNINRMVNFGPHSAAQQLLHNNVTAAADQATPVAAAKWPDKGCTRKAMRRSTASNLLHLKGLQYKAKAAAHASLSITIGILILRRCC